MTPQSFYERLVRRIFCVTAVIDLCPREVTFEYVSTDSSLCQKTVSLAEARKLLSEYVSFDTNGVLNMTYEDLLSVYKDTYRKKSFLLSCEVKRNVLKKYIMSLYPAEGEKKIYVTVSESESSEKVLTFKSKKTEVSFDMQKIVYVGYGNHCVEFYFSDSGCSRLFNVLFCDIADVLLQHKNFVRSYKNCIVNMDKVGHISNDCFIMSDGSNIPIPKRRCKDIMHTYGEYMILKSNTLELD